MTPPDIAESASGSGIARIDRRPYFEKALSYGVEHLLIDPLRRDAIVTDGAKGTVQVAQYFGTSHLFTALDNARKRIVHLVSLYLEHQYGDDLAKAAKSLQENTFLSHSRGGNEMLKKLHAMPESAVFDGGMKSQELKDFQDERTLAKPMTCAAYRKELQRRLVNESSLAAARWFAQDMRLPADALDSVAAEAVIRTALLQRLDAGSKAVMGVKAVKSARGDNTGSTPKSCPNRPEFAVLIGRLKDTLTAKGKLAFARTALDDVPEQHQPFARAVRREIEKQDLPLLADTARHLDAVLDLLDARYFLRETGLEDIDGFDAFVSQEWAALTKGKEDPYSRLTVLLCLASGVKPKTTLSVTEARALIRRVREHGFDEDAVPDLINASAPFSIRSDLLSMWEDEFFPEAQMRLLDEVDEKYVFAMQFLNENCNIRKK